MYTIQLSVTLTERHRNMCKSLLQGMAVIMIAIAHHHLASAMSRVDRLSCASRSNHHLGTGLSSHAQTFTPHGQTQAAKRCLGTTLHKLVATIPQHLVDRADAAWLISVNPVEVKMHHAVSVYFGGDDDNERYFTCLMKKLIS